MDVNSFLLGIAATVIGGLTVATILGTLGGAARFIHSILSDIHATTTALREGKYKEADAYDKRAMLKMAGCACLMLLAEIAFVIVAIVVLLVVATSATKR